MAQSERKHEQIVAAAVDEFLQRGFSGASMDRIADSAGVSKRTVYNHFENKEALFHTILDYIFEEASETIDVAYVRGEPLRPQLLALGHAEGRLLQSKRFMKMIRAALAETIRDPVIASELNARHEQITAFRDFMVDAIGAGALTTDDADEANEQFMGLIKSRAFWPYVLSGAMIDPAELDLIIESSVETFMLRFAATPS